MLPRTQWLHLARQLDWKLSYVSAEDAFPPELAGKPWLPPEAWSAWDEPFKTSYGEYVAQQHAKEAALAAVRDAVGRADDVSRLDPGWRAARKLHAATLPLAEFAAVVGNLRAARHGRASAWRSTALLGALDELRHTQIPLLLMSELVPSDPQVDWTHRLLHTNDWVAIAARHFVDELLLHANPIELGVATNFVFETGFTNLQFIGLAAMAHRCGDRMFEKMLQSIQTDEARHAQIGGPVLTTLLQHDPEYAQFLVDKWFWRSWLFFAVVTGFAMDYLTPLAGRTASFKEFVEEWILEQFQRSLQALGLKLPWYWDHFRSALDYYHHMVYASAYTYRATVWFDMVVPGPDERAWLREKYPHSWSQLDPIWEQVSRRWRTGGPELEWFTHGATPVAFCHLCQLVLCGGTPANNLAEVVVIDGVKRVFCSPPCRWIFEREPERYRDHKDVVTRIRDGEAPANLLELLGYFGLDRETWGHDLYNGRYPWLAESR